MHNRKEKDINTMTEFSSLTEKYSSKNEIISEINKLNQSFKFYKNDTKRTENDMDDGLNKPIDFQTNADKLNRMFNF